jgi:hypothetical protein
MPKGKGLLMLLAGGKPKAGGKSDLGSEAKEQAASDMLKAIKSDDASGVADAFKRMYDACVAAESEGYEEDEDYEED